MLVSNVRTRSSTLSTRDEACTNELANISAYNQSVSNEDTAASCSFKTPVIKRQLPKRKVTAKTGKAPTTPKTKRAKDSTKARLCPAALSLQPIILNDIQEEITQLKVKMMSIDSSLSVLRTLEPLTALMQKSKSHKVEHMLSAGSLIDSIATEVVGRMDRSKNAVIFNVPDNIMLAALRDILLKATNMVGTECSCIRLRKQVQRHACPILLKFHSALNASEFISRQHQIVANTTFKTLKVIPDRTPLQRLLLHGDSDLILRRDSLPANVVVPTAAASLVPNCQTDTRIIKLPVHDDTHNQPINISYHSDPSQMTLRETNIIEPPTFKTKRHRHYEPVNPHPEESYLRQLQSIKTPVVDLDMTTIVPRDLIAFRDNERPGITDTALTNAPPAGGINPVSSTPSSLKMGSTDATPQNPESPDTQDHSSSQKIATPPPVLSAWPAQTLSPDKPTGNLARPMRPLVYSVLAFNIPDSADLLDTVATLGKVANVKPQKLRVTRVPKRLQTYPAPVRFSSVDQLTLASLISELNAIRKVPHLSNIYFSRLLAKPLVSAHPKMSATSILGEPYLPTDLSRNINPTCIPDMSNQLSVFVEMGRKLSVIPPHQAFNIFLTFLKMIQI